MANTETKYFLLPRNLIGALDVAKKVLEGASFSSGGVAGGSFAAAQYETAGWAVALATALGLLRLTLSWVLAFSVQVDPIPGFGEAGPTAPSLLFSPSNKSQPVTNHR